MDNVCYTMKKKSVQKSNVFYSEVLDSHGLTVEL